MILLGEAYGHVRISFWGTFLSLSFGVPFVVGDMISVLKTGLDYLARGGSSILHSLDMCPFSRRDWRISPLSYISWEVFFFSWEV